ncbi:hypothetical protein [[Clostridium] fimetarium]|nr:hypothetical protein [[Clostridium] fimetarium]
MQKQLSELVKAFHLLDKASVTRGKGAVVCMKQKLSAVDNENLIIPIYLI